MRLVEEHRARRRRRASRGGSRGTSPCSSRRAGVGGCGSRSWSNFHRPCSVSNVMSKHPSLSSLACWRLADDVERLRCHRHRVLARGRVDPRDLARRVPGGHQLLDAANLGRRGVEGAVEPRAVDRRRGEAGEGQVRAHRAVLSGDLLGDEGRRRRGHRRRQGDVETAAAGEGAASGTGFDRRPARSASGGASSRHAEESRDAHRQRARSARGRARISLAPPPEVSACSQRACRSRPTSPRPSIAPSTPAPTALVAALRSASTTTPSFASRSTRPARGSPTSSPRAVTPVERGVAGLPTAFRARAGSGAPRVAILAEYDALPGVGHACGHNLIAAGAVGAFVAAAAGGLDGRRRGRPPGNAGRGGGRREDHHDRGRRVRRASTPR